MKFIDLFAGIGGFHLAFHELGHECVFASEIDKNARITYEANLSSLSPQLFESGMYNDDIRKITDPVNQVPDFDILCAGFPCQPFSQAGFDLEFVDVKSDFFRENLQLIDSSMDVFLADCLLVFMQDKITGLEEIVKLVSIRNPCKFKASSPKRLLDFYQYKMKRLIVDAALGMQPKSLWTGVYDASGGYIVVKSTGDVICYHLYNWNALQDYLFKKLKFETPTSTGSGSKASFNYGLYYSVNGEHFMDICLQLRFK